MRTIRCPRCETLVWRDEGSWAAHRTVCPPPRSKEPTNWLPLAVWLLALILSGATWGGIGYWAWVVFRHANGG